MEDIVPIRAAFDGYTNWGGLYIKGGHYSVTDLLDSPRIIQLRNRHKSELPEESVEGLWKSYQGNAWHSAFEKNLRRAASLPQYRDRFLIEAKFWERVEGRKIAGKLDCYDAHTGTLYDFKVTSTYKAMFGDTTDWEIQLNVYAWFLAMNGFEVKRIVIVCIHPEWNKYQMMNDKQYPRHPIHEIELKLWSFEEQEALVRQRISALRDSEELPDDELPECTAEDMWEKQDKYAVIVPKRRAAARTTDTEEEAHAWVDWNNQESEKPSSKRKKIDKYEVEYRPGERTRCNEYCRVKHFCSQYIEYCMEREGHE